MANQFTIKVDSREVRAAIRDIQEWAVPYATATALTWTGQDVKAALTSTMESVFDRPTTYTLNALQLKPATKDDLVAIVGYRAFAGKGTPAEKFLGPQVDGGTRKHKSHERALIAAGIMRSDEYAVPGKGVPLDAQGNVPGKTLTQILSQLKAHRDPTQNMTAKSRKRAIMRSSGQFFVLRNASTGAPDGIYQRLGGRAIDPILIFAREPKYQKRFPFYEVARDVFARQVAGNARAAWDRIVARKLKR